MSAGTTQPRVFEDCTKDVPVVYVAGPYRAATVAGIRSNIEAARAIAERLWRIGCPCICPHLNTAFMDGIAPDDVFLKGDLALLSRCQSVVLVPGWEASEGTRREVEYAKTIGIPVYGSIEELMERFPGDYYDLDKRGVKR